jgi:carboxyl-terminal processing protease
MTARLLTDRIAYVRIYTFQIGRNITAQVFTKQLDAALFDLESQAPVGWILDLRNNPGGAELLGGYVAGRLGATGTLVENRGRNGSRSSLRITTTSVTGGRPVVILVNEFSFSTSEMLAAAFQDGSFGRVIGTKTLGRANSGSPFEVAGGALEITVSRAFAGLSQRYLDQVGVVPDVAIALDRDSLAAGHDGQLDEAIAEILRSALPAPILTR